MSSANPQVRTSPPAQVGPTRHPTLLGRLNARGFRLLQLADALVLLAIMAAMTQIRFIGRAPTYPWGHYLAGFLLAVAIHLTVYYFGGLYERELRLGNKPLLPRIVGLTTAAVGFDLLAETITARQLMPHLNLLAGLPVLGSLMLAGNRRIARNLRRKREGLPRVLLVGAPDEVNLARAHLLEEGKAHVVGQTGSARNLTAEVTRSGATEVLLLSGRLLDELYPEPLTELESRNIGLLQRVSARDTLLGLTAVREIGGMPFVALRTHTLPVSRARFKRCLELLGVLATAPLTLPTLLVIAVYVRIVAGPGVLYRQERVGRDGRLFQLVKFRTMYDDAEADVGPILAQRRDPRVVPACQWLRSARLDELPQLYNVLRGEMSVVGPRPERPELTRQYIELIPGYARRHEIPPGITGLAQIHGRYHTDPEYKLGHDLQYLVNWSPVLDLQVLLRTVWVVLTGRV